MRVFAALTPSPIYSDILKECEQKHVLISFHFIKSVTRLIALFDGWFPENLIIDSGAFSVWSNGGSVDIDAYATFCAELKSRIPSSIRLYVVNLDVLPGKFGMRPTVEQRKRSAELGWENMLYLEAKGLKTIHVYHQHEDLVWLERLKNHSDYIGISPANDVSMNEKLEFLNDTFSNIKATVRTHGFAVTSPKQVYQYPFFSVDSSSWTSPARYGRIPIVKDDYSMTSVEYKNKDEVIKHWDYLKHIGIDDLSHVTDYSFRVKVAVKAYQEMERVATKLWTNRGIKFNED